MEENIALFSFQLTDTVIKNKVGHFKFNSKITEWNIRYRKMFLQYKKYWKLIIIGWSFRKATIRLMWLLCDHINQSITIAYDFKSNNNQTNQVFKHLRFGPKTTNFRAQCGSCLLFQKLGKFCPPTFNAR